MPEDEKTIIAARFYFYKGYSIKQIAKMLGATEKFISTAVADIMEKVESLEDE